MRPGESFEDAEVAGFYAHRPDYPREIFDRLLALSPGREALLDLGCGTGKLARGLAHGFNRTTAIDASREMLATAARLAGEDATGINWVRGLAETASLEGGPFDLIVAGASIHWMDQAVVFPRLLAAASDDHLFAAVDGDGAHEPPWQVDWEEFLSRWIYELKGETFEPHRVDGAHRAKMTRHLHWIDVQGEAEIVSAPVTQSVESFVACQHSRDTFAPYKLGPRMTRFDAELTELLTPHAHDGQLCYRVRTSMSWGSIRGQPKGR